MGFWYIRVLHTLDNIVGQCVCAFASVTVSGYLFMRWKRKRRHFHPSQLENVCQASRCPVTVESMFSFFTQLQKTAPESIKCIFAGYIILLWELRLMININKLTWMGFLCLQDDYRVCMEFKIIQRDDTPICPVDASGCFTAEVTDFAGQYVKVSVHLRRISIRRSLFSMQVCRPLNCIKLGRERERDREQEIEGGGDRGRYKKQRESIIERGRGIESKIEGERERMKEPPSVTQPPGQPACAPHSPASLQGCSTVCSLPRLPGGTCDCWCQPADLLPAQTLVNSTLNYRV